MAKVPVDPNTHDVRPNVQPQCGVVYQDLSPGVEPYNVSRVQTNSRLNRRSRPWRRGPYAAHERSGSAWHMIGAMVAVYLAIVRVAVMHVAVLPEVAYGSRQSMPRDVEPRDNYYPFRGHSGGQQR